MGNTSSKRNEEKRGVLEGQFESFINSEIFWFKETISNQREIEIGLCRETEGV